ncbi:MAG: ATP-binding protein [Anaerolineae bacterium]|nr:ATP-binding protein [Anaerolineae bacterium]
MVGHTQTVLDPEAVRFAARLYAELTDGYPLREAVSRAQRAVTTHEVVLLGDDALRFEHLTRSEPWIDERQPRGNLPARSKFFFGRGRELVRLAQRLAQPPCVVVLSGAPAIGKTSLALEAANRNAWRFPGGVAYAACPDDAPSTAADLFNQLAEGLQVQPQSFAPKAVSAELVAYARLQPTLFVLDNAHALPEGELAQVQQFLRQLGGGSAAIIVSRLSLLLEKVPAATPLLVHQGVGTQAATYQALYLARQRNIPLETSEAQEIAVASDGHPRLVELLVVHAGRRDLRAVLEQVRARQGDFQAQLERIYAWSAKRLGKRHRGAWQALLLFPANIAPEMLLQRAATHEGVQALREAALADFDPEIQAWRWHATVSEYARGHFPLSEDMRRKRWAELLPTWRAWAARLSSEDRRAVTQLEAQEGNLRAMLAEWRSLPEAGMLELVRSLHRALPAPDRTLRLRAFEVEVYRVWAALASQEKERAEALWMLGCALGAVGQREAALQATQEAVSLYRQLAQANPQAFLPDLAASLHNLGARLSEVGQREAALKAALESVSIRRQLARDNPRAFLPRLILSLSMLVRVLEHYPTQDGCAALAEGLAEARTLAAEHALEHLDRLAELQQRYQRVCA